MSTKRRWLLPEAIEDLLPAEARQVEVLRRRVLDEFARSGYEFVAPPLLEYVESLLTGSGQDLDLRTFKLVDQLSGRTVGIRADITPQVARIDAHLLNRRGVARLCYCGSVLHALPAGLLASREPIQIGAELYGHAGIEADIEIVRLLARTLVLCEIPTARIDLGHIGIFRALAARAEFSAEAQRELFAVLQAKDASGLREMVAGVAEPLRSAFLALPECYGGAAALDAAARRLPDLPEIRAALDGLRRLSGELADLPLGFDLADLRGYHYHSGVVVAAYCAGSPSAVALGGRYDQVGESFGRGRPATGFSLDLRAVARLAPQPGAKGAILAPWPEDEIMHSIVAQLRAAGETVVYALPGHEGTWTDAGCDRALVRRGAEWTIETLKED
ncbi:MAG: ATP phosphoribosyltransferase regulatory subunit [Rhodocyclales bacterium GWA2_65_20]|nr:MAG: ATP phosphoribosyltransferase regulatory subunit [Rhodocyclales bacterium GWA2_65_20]